jgi:hypothetical protein
MYVHACACNIGVCGQVCVETSTAPFYLAISAVCIKLPLFSAVASQSKLLGIKFYFCLSHVVKSPFLLSITIIMMPRGIRLQVIHACPECAMATCSDSVSVI